MLTGHLAFSYLLSLIPMLLGIKLSLAEQGFIILCGAVLDTDFIFPYFSKKAGAMHHFLPTHTPAFCFILITVLYFLLNKYISILSFFLGFVALISHLMLDDFGHLLYKLKIDNSFKRPQIFWLYPYDKRRDYWANKINMTNKEAVQLFFKEPYSWKVEVFLITAAILIFCILGLITPL
jgi:hypothetical protein